MWVDTCHVTIPGALTEEECDEAVRLGDAIALKRSLIPGAYFRDSDIGFFFIDRPEYRWLYDRLNAQVERVNESHWGWDVPKPVHIQYTTYGPEQRYDWHLDARLHTFVDGKPDPEMVRKITITVQLSRPGECDGGDFLIELPHPEPDRHAERIVTVTEARTRGTATVFAAHLFHRVTPIIRGRRRSLVYWFLGPPFR